MPIMPATSSCVRRASRINARAASAPSSEEVRGDREIILEAFKRNPKALKFASENLRADDLIQATAGEEVTKEDLYVAAYEEIQNNKYDKKLFGQALAQAGGNIEKAKNIYIKLRVASVGRDLNE